MGFQLLITFSALFSSAIGLKRPFAISRHRPLHSRRKEKDAKIGSSVYEHRQESPRRNRWDSFEETTASIRIPRGGSDPYGSYESQPDEYAEQQPHYQEQSQQQQSYYNPEEERERYYNDNYQPFQNTGEYYYNNENDDAPAMVDDPLHETVQDRVDRWKASQTTEHQDLGPRDAQGRLKLLTSVGKGSRAVVFVAFVLRDLYYYERTNNLSNFLRFPATMTILTMLLLNCAGVIAAISSPSHSSKKRLKAILNLDKVVEIVVVLQCFLRLLVPGSVPREILIGTIFHSFFFLVNAQAITKFSWDETEGVPISSYQTPAQQQQQHYQY